MQQKSQLMPHRHLLEPALRLLKSGVHGTHDCAIFKLSKAQIERR
jgi:hypothetical protein